MIDRRRADLERHLVDLRKNDGWQPFQHFVLGLLHYEGYRDLRYSAPRSDFGRDAVGITPDGKRCVVAVSFECTKAKVLGDAKRWAEDPNREAAEVLLFITSQERAETTWSKWKPAVAKLGLGLELRMFHRGSILPVATRDGVWRETCARLGIPGDRPGYRVVTPYDGEQVRAALQARPAEWLAKRIELREWAQLSGEIRNRLILGKPGAGKTTTLFMHLETVRPPRVLVVEPDLRVEKVQELVDAASGGGVIVFDDAHEKPNELRALMSALRARQRDVPEVSARSCDVRLLIAARSQEWGEIQPPFSPTELQDLDLTRSAQVVLGALSREQCREFVVACIESWGISAEPRLIDLAATRAAERDATPLYVLSMLAPAREAGMLRDDHLAHLPPSVLELWQAYWLRLTAEQQGVLRIVKLFADTAAPSEMELFTAGTGAFSLTPHDVSASLASLETALWISRGGDVPTSLDVQLEAIPLESDDLTRWDEFVGDTAADDGTRAQLHNGTGNYYWSARAPRARESRSRRSALLSALTHYNSVATLVGVGDLIWRSGALNNMSVVYSDLAVLETTREGRGEWLRKASEAVEEAVRIYRELGVQGYFAMSLNNVSVHYSDLAGLETTREGRSEWLRKAAGAVEEAVRIYRELGGQGDLAMSLNNLSNGYAALANLETTREGRGERLRTAVETVEEAVRISRELGVQGDLARSLNNVSVAYSELAGLETTREGRGDWLRRAVEAVEEAVRIYRELGVPGNLAVSLNNVSVRYSDLATVETTREGRGKWLRKALEAVEEAVRIQRELGVQGDLAMSLGASSRVRRKMAKNSDDPDAALEALRASRSAIGEAVELFRKSGNAPYFLQALQDVVMSDLLLARAGDEVDTTSVRAAGRTGLELAQSMQDDEMLAFFEQVLGTLDASDEPESTSMD